MRDGVSLNATIYRPAEQKNYNSGGDVSRETADDARTVNVTVFHDAEHPARLNLPLDVD